MTVRKYERYQGNIRDAIGRWTAVKIKVPIALDREINEYLATFKDNWGEGRDKLDVQKSLLLEGHIDITKPLDKDALYVTLMDLGYVYNMYTHPNVKLLQSVLDNEDQSIYKMGAYSRDVMGIGNIRRIYFKRNLAFTTSGDNIVDEIVAGSKMWYNLASKKMDYNNPESPYIFSGDVSDDIAYARQAKIRDILTLELDKIKPIIKEILKRTGYDKIKELRG